VTSEESLSVALHDIADNADTPPAPVTELIRRGRRSRRARRLRRAVVAAGVVVAVSGAAAVTLTAREPRATPAEVVSPVEAPDEVSFRFTKTGTTLKGKASACHGALDPKAEVGWEQGTGSNRYEIRFTGGTQYVKEVGQPWRAEPRSPFEQSLSCPEPVPGPATVDAEALVSVLQERGTVEHTGRTGTVDTYTFSYTVKNGQLAYSGTIEADVASRYLRKVTLRFSGKGIDNRFTTEYSGFGEPVVVTAPKV
jgi:hypothetical protein